VASGCCSVVISTHAGDDSDGKLWGIEGINILETILNGRAWLPPRRQPRYRFTMKAPNGRISHDLFIGTTSTGVGSFSRDSRCKSQKEATGNGLKLSANCLPDFRDSSPTCPLSFFVL
jgi:hypothetical protein